MSLEAYLLYLSVLAAFFAAPPDTSQLLIMTHSLRHGLRKSLATVAEDLTANTLQILLAGFGLTIVIAAHAQALSVIKWAGVAYLCWLGLRLFIRKDRAATPVEAAPGWLFRQGFFTSSANPYAVVFFCGPVSAIHRCDLADLAAASDPWRNLSGRRRGAIDPVGLARAAQVGAYPITSRALVEPLFRRPDDRRGRLAGQQGY